MSVRALAFLPLPRTPQLDEMGKPWWQLSPSFLFYYLLPSLFPEASLSVSSLLELATATVGAGLLFVYLCVSHLPGYLLVVRFITVNDYVMNCNVSNIISFCLRMCLGVVMNVFLIKSGVERPPLNPDGHPALWLKSCSYQVAASTQRKKAEAALREDTISFVWGKYIFCKRKKVGEWI